MAIPAYGSSAPANFISIMIMIMIMIISIIIIIIFIRSIIFRSFFIIINM